MITADTKIIALLGQIAGGTSGGGGAWGSITGTLSAQTDLQSALDAKQAADADLTTWAGITPGTGVATALAIAVGSAGAPVVLNGALGTPSSGTVTNLTGTASININGTVGATTPGTGAFTTLTNTGAAINSVAGAASTPALKVSGVPFAGTGTTSFPLVYINDSNATASTTMSTSGTSLGVNAHTGIGNLFELMLDGASKFKITSTGIVTTNAQMQIGTNASWLQFGASGPGIQGTGNNNDLRLIQAAAGRLNFGGDTNNFPAIGRDAVNGFTLQSAAGTTTYNDPSTANSGTVANRYLFGIAAPTLTSTGTSVTDTVASTVYIGGAPTASTNTTITTPYALNVAAGVVKFGGGTVILPTYTVGTLPSTAATGMVTGAMAYVTDAAAVPIYNATVAAGGSVVIPVFYNGANWVNH